MSESAQNKANSYIPLARKYRPSNFAELRGQDVLVRTLSHCINQSKFASAYLLTGIRGVGKTSSARIIAKTINCEKPQHEQGLTLPCQQCSNCQSFDDQNHPDILEMDAASRTSIDDIREIIESAEYRPLQGRYKFFIIDEIHMLSKSAFNGLLKIVEEPPEHIIFIFATTEVQKIPSTIISRCQRYDLSRFSFDEMMQLMQHIVQQEQLNITDEALRIIIHQSEGSARDAISILDQLSSYVLNGEGAINADDVSNMLGLVEVDVILEFMELLFQKEAKKLINLLHKIYYKSHNLEHFIEQISDFTAELCKYKVINGYSNPLYADYSEKISNLIIDADLSKLNITWQILSNGLVELKRSHNELVCAEMLSIKLIYSYGMPKIEYVLAGQEVEQIVEATETAKAEKAQNDSNNLDIGEFLQYCQQHKKMDLYYHLMNNIEIISFDRGKITLAGDAKQAVLTELKNSLGNWLNIEWAVNMQKKTDFTPLKQQIANKAQASKEYGIIKNAFPKAQISDIILNTKNEEKQ